MKDEKEHLLLQEDQDYQQVWDLKAVNDAIITLRACCGFGLHHKDELDKLHNSVKALIELQDRIGVTEQLMNRDSDVIKSIYSQCFNNCKQWDLQTEVVAGCDHPLFVKNDDLSEVQKLFVSIINFGMQYAKWRPMGYQPPISVVKTKNVQSEQEDEKQPLLETKDETQDVSIVEQQQSQQAAQLQLNQQKLTVDVLQDLVEALTVSVEKNREISDGYADSLYQKAQFLNLELKKLPKKLDPNIKQSLTDVLEKFAKVRITTIGKIVKSWQQTMKPEHGFAEVMKTVNRQRTYRQLSVLGSRHYVFRALRHLDVMHLADKKLSRRINNSNTKLEKEVNVRIESNKQLVAENKADKSFFGSGNPVWQQVRANHLFISSFADNQTLQEYIGSMDKAGFSQVQQTFAQLAKNESEKRGTPRVASKVKSRVSSNANSTFGSPSQSPNTSYEETPPPQNGGDSKKDNLDSTDVVKDLNEDFTNLATDTP